jgi:hypothetical protein
MAVVLPESQARLFAPIRREAPLTRPAAEVGVGSRALPPRRPA